VPCLHEEVFAEVNYHAAYEPMRCVRTTRHKYIRRYDERRKMVLPNVDDTPSKEFLLGQDWVGLPRDQEELYDLVFDPDETHNLAGLAHAQEVLDDMRARLDTWMRDTDDPLLPDGRVPAPVGVRVNDPDGRSPRDETQTAP